MSSRSTARRTARSSPAVVAAPAPVGPANPTVQVPTLDVVGELTVQTAAEHKARLLGLLAAGDVLDVALSGVTELDTAGLQLLLMVRQEAHLTGKTVRFRSPSAAVTDVLSVARLTDTCDEVDR